MRISHNISRITGSEGILIWRIKITINEINVDLQVSISPLKECMHLNRVFSGQHSVGWASSAFVDFTSGFYNLTKKEGSQRIGFTWCGRFEPRTRCLLQKQLLTL